MRNWLYSLLLVTLFSASPGWANWREASSKHFVIYSEQNPKTLQEFAESLERYDKGLRILFGAPDNQVSHASRVTIFILRGMGDVQRAYGDKSADVAGFYQDWPSGPVAFVPRSTDDEEFGFSSQLVIQHEYAHHFLMQNFPFVFPAWVNEGFAEFASTADRQKDGTVRFGLAAQHRAYSLLADSPLPIEKLLNSEALAGTSDDIERFYARSWLLCDYLIVDPARQGQLPAYIKRLNAGGTSLDAARETFGDLKQLNKDLNTYLRQIQIRMRAFALSPKALAIGEPTLRELGPGENAIMNVRIQSKAGVDKKEAPQVALMARKAAASYPDDPAAQTALAEAEFDAGNFAEAEAAADRAIAADPKAVDALTYKGMARMRQAMVADKRDAASWTDIRKWFLAANRIDSDDPEPLTYFFYSYLRQGIEPTPNAIAASTRALDLAPQSTALRMTLIQYLLRHDKPAEARAALMWLASDPHTPALREAASAMISALDTGGASAALGALATKEQSLKAEEGQEGGGL